MAKTKRPNDRRGDGDPIAQWRKAHDKWSDTLPKHRECDADGHWRFAMNDDERIAAGWERVEGWASERDPVKIAAWKPKDAADLARGPMRSLGLVNWFHPGPDPQREAAAALAEATDRLALEVERRGKSSGAAIRLAEKLRDRPWADQQTVERVDEVLRLLRELEFAVVAKHGNRTEAPPGKQHDDIDDELVEILRRAGRTMKPAEIGETLSDKREDSVIRKRLAKLARSGKIDRDGRGNYWHPSISARR